MIKEISQLLLDVSHESPTNMNSRILLDALTIDTLNQTKGDFKRKDVENLIKKTILTEAGQEIAMKTLLGHR